MRISHSTLVSNLVTTTLAAFAALLVASLPLPADAAKRAPLSLSQTDRGELLLTELRQETKTFSQRFCHEWSALSPRLRSRPAFRGQGLCRGRLPLQGDLQRVQSPRWERRILDWQLERDFLLAGGRLDPVDDEGVENLIRLVQIQQDRVGLLQAFRTGGQKQNPVQILDSKPRSCRQSPHKSFWRSTETHWQNLAGLNELAKSIHYKASRSGCFH